MLEPHDICISKIILYRASILKRLQNKTRVINRRDRERYWHFDKKDTQCVCSLTTSSRITVTAGATSCEVTVPREDIPFHFGISLSRDREAVEMARIDDSERKYKKR